MLLNLATIRYINNKINFVTMYLLAMISCCSLIWGEELKDKVDALNLVNDIKHMPVFEWYVIGCKLI